MSINYEKSAELNGVSVEDLKKRFERFPKSTKRVIAICDGCGFERNLSFCKSHKLCKSCSLKKRYSDPKEHEKLSIAGKKSYQDNPTRSQTQSVNGKKRYEDPKEHEKQSIKMKTFYEDPEECKKISSGVKRAHINDPTISQRKSKSGKKRWEDPKEREKQSARFQGIPYEEWTNYINKDQPHLTPCHACIHLNSKFKGCNQHHIMSGVIINIPTDLHRSIQHMMPHDNRKGENMKEINKLAFKYLMEGI